MTGGLLIKNGNPDATIETGLLLEVAGRGSGDILHAQSELHSSGSLTIEGTSRLNGVTIFNEDSGNANHVRMESDNQVNMFFLDATNDKIGIGTSAPKATFDVIGTVSGSALTIQGGGTATFAGNLTFGDAIGDALTVNAGSWTFANDTNFVLSGGVNGLSFDTNTLSVDALNNRIGIGTTTPDNPLEVVGTISGTSLKTSNGISASGTLALEGTLTGAVLKGFGLNDCDTAATSKLLYDITTGKFSCGTDQTSAGGGAGLTRIAGNSGAAGVDLTWQNLTANSTDCTTTALCAAVMTTTGVGIGTWKFKYTLNYQTAATTTGIGIAVNHTGTATTPGIIWTHLTSGGAAATGIGDDVAATAAGQLIEGKNGRTLNATIGSLTVGVVTANANTAAIVEGIVVVTASGNLELKVGSEVAASAVRIMANSTLELIKVQ